MTAAPPRTAPPRGPLDRRVLALAPALRTHLVTSSALALAVAAAVLLQAEGLARLLPRLVSGDGAAVAPLVGLLLVAAAIRALAAVGFERSSTRAIRRTRRAVRAEVLDKVALIRLDRRDELGPARVLGLTSGAADALDPWVRSYLPALVLAAVVPLAAGARILVADPTSAAVLVVVVPLVPLFMVLIGRATEARTARDWASLQRLSGRFLDTLEGLPTLRLFGRADAQVARVREVTERYRATTMGTLRVAFLSALVLELLATLSVALVAVSLGIRLTHGGLDLTTALVVLLLAPECLLPLRRVSAAFHAAASGVDAAVEVDDALVLPERAAGSAPLPAPGPLVLDEVAVLDPRRGARLAPTSLAVAPGRIVAVTGPSGSGKSTLLDVARGALAPTSGSARLGPVDTGTLDPTARAAGLRWVPQRPGALGSTVIASAALGHPPGPDTAAALTDVLGDLGLAGHALDAPAGLSGGELRRLGLARALVGVTLGGVRHLLVDEPTAQLDEVSAARVVAALRGVAALGVGVLVATHDPRLVAVADDVVALAPASAAAPPPVVDPLPGDGSVRRVDGPDQSATLDAASSSGPAEALGRPADGAAHTVARVGSGGSALRWLARTAGVPWRRLAGAWGLGIAAEACTVGLAGTAAWLVIRAAEQPSFADLAVAAVAVRAFGLGKGVLRYGERLASHDATLRLLARLRAQVVGGLAHRAPVGIFAAERGDALQRVVADVDRLQDLPLRVVGPAVSGLVVAAGAVAVAAAISVPGGLAIGAAALVVGVGLPAAAHRRARRASTATATARGDLAAAVVALADRAEELVACGAESGARAGIDAAARRLDRLDADRSRLDAVTAAVAAAAPAATVAAVVAAVGAATGGISGPALGVVVLLPLAVLELLGTLTPVGAVLASVEAAAERIRALVDGPIPVVDPASPHRVPATGDLVLARVAVGWPGRAPVVEGLDLDVAEGGRVLVTGPSGSGKSTLAATLVRFVPERAGRLEVGGVAASALRGDDVRRLVTWCPQDPWFADTSLADNLRVARPGASDDELWRALETVRLGTWARALPDGLATRLSRDAAAMSGGERQRLALARALLGDRRTVVLDEPVSHLDADTADDVLAALLAATADRAVVVLGHAAEDLAWDGPVVALDAPPDDAPVPGGAAPRLRAVSSL